MNCWQVLNGHASSSQVMTLRIPRSAFDSKLSLK